MAHANIAVIILTYNQKAQTLHCLSSLAEVTGATLHILLWDNGSLDETRTAVRRQFPEVMTHYHPQNIGVASGRNRAAEMAIAKWTPRYLFFMDNDMEVTPELLSALVAPFAEDPLLAQTTGKILDMFDRERLYGAGGCRLRFWMGDTRHIGYGEVDRGQYNRPHYCLPSGGCMMIRTDLFQEVGGFDTRFDPYGPEDLDLGLRLRQRGYHALYVPEAVIYHGSQPGRTFEEGQYTQAYADNRVRHWIQFMNRHASMSQKVGFWLIGMPHALLGLLRRAHRNGNLWPTLLGVLSAMRSLNRG